MSQFPHERTFDSEAFWLVCKQKHYENLKCSIVHINVSKKDFRVEKSTPDKLCINKSFTTGVLFVSVEWLFFVCCQFFDGDSNKNFHGIFSFIFWYCMHVCDEKLETFSLVSIWCGFQADFDLRIFFSCFSFSQGFTVLVCFVIKAETKLKSESLNKSNSKQIIEDYCSGSINSPLNCK